MGGRKRFKAISQPVVEESWVSFRSLPPKEAIVAVVLKDMVLVDAVITAESFGGMVNVE